MTLRVVEVVLRELGPGLGHAPARVHPLHPALQPQLPDIHPVRVNNRSVKNSFDIEWYPLQNIDVNSANLADLYICYVQDGK